MINQTEFAYLEYIHKQGGSYMADDLTRHYLGSRFGLSAAKFQEMHGRLVEKHLLAVASEADPLNSTASSASDFRVSITQIGEKALKRPKTALPVRTSAWWNPRTWWRKDARG
jgi:hypothetical protein